MSGVITGKTLNAYLGQDVIRGRSGNEVRGRLRREESAGEFFLVTHRGRRIGTRDNPRFLLRRGDDVWVQIGQSRKGADGKREVVDQFRRFEFTG